MRPLFFGIAVAIASFAATTATTAARDTEPTTPAPVDKPKVTLKLDPYEAKVPGTTISMPFVPISVGRPGYPATFRMGSPESDENRKPDEASPFEVTMAPFWIGKFEVTWDEFNEFREQYSKLLEQRVSKNDDAANEWADAVSIPTPLWEQDSRPILMGMGEKGGYPVADISRYAARQFTKWLSKKTGHFYRLPTEAEWEYAARAGTTTRYFFGDDPDPLGDYAWTFDNSEYEDLDKGYPGMGAGYRKVGQKKPNPWGLHDIYGNVSEWVIDAYDAKGYARFGGKPQAWNAAIVWPTKIFPGVARGGNWEAEPEDCRSAARLESSRELQRRDPQIPKSIWWYTDAFHIGFRVVRPLVEPSEDEKRRYWGDGTIAKIERILTTGGKQLRAKVDAAPKK